MDITRIIEALKLSTGQLFTLFLILMLSAGTLLFGPDVILELTGVLEIPKPYNILPGIAFIVSVVGTLVTGTVYASLKASPIIKRLQSRKRREERLQKLTPPERAILSRYIEGNTRTQHLSSKDGVVRGLADENIIYRSSNIADWNFRVDFNIQPWVWIYLNDRPELVLGEEKT